MVTYVAAHIPYPGKTLFPSVAWDEIQIPRNNVQGSRDLVPTSLWVLCLDVPFSDPHTRAIIEINY